MTSEIIVAVIAALGGLSGSVIGMVRSSRLVNYRIDQLEKKVDAYEKAKDHLCGLEEKVEVLQEQVRTLNAGIERIEKQEEEGVEVTKTVKSGTWRFSKTFTFRTALNGFALC